MNPPTHLVTPLAAPPDCAVVVPGSKSITNRALVAALLADGTSVLDGVLFSDDTEAMLGIIDQLGGNPAVDRERHRVTVQGVNGTLRQGPLDLDVRMSGTTARFTVPLASRGEGTYTVDGTSHMQARPMKAVADALRSLGVDVRGDRLPLEVHGGMTGGTVTLAADITSQFTSGLLLAAPGLAHGLSLELEGDVVSKPYLTMTVEVMRAFGADVDVDGGKRFDVPATSRYLGTKYQIEPDASAASYFLAAAAVTGGTVRINGLGADSLQGDVGFARALEAMGATIDLGPDHITVSGPDQLRGIDIDMADISDTAQTLAAIAPFASSPTRVTGIGFIRNKETDRVAAVVHELQRLGIDATEDDDGFTIQPGQPQPATIRTYDDHRMAMSFAVTGLKAPGITIADPDCVAKTFPDFFDAIDQLR